VQDDSSAGDDLVLVPVAFVDEGPELRAVADGSDELRWFTGEGLDDLAAPDDDAARGVLRVELAAVLLVAVIGSKPIITQRGSRGGSPLPAVRPGGMPVLDRY
jgi:hypothetical protein